MYWYCYYFISVLVCYRGEGNREGDGETAALQGNGVPSRRQRLHGANPETLYMVPGTAD